MDCWGLDKTEISKRVRSVKHIYNSMLYIGEHGPKKLKRIT